MRAACMSFLAVGSAAAVKYEDVTVGGYTCQGIYRDQTARVFYPETSAKVPAISFAHGYTAAGNQAYGGYQGTIEGVAAAGYVVIVPKSSALPAECKTQWKDQTRSLEWLKTSSLSNKIDYSKKTGIWGHSMGGGNTYHNAGVLDSIKSENIGAAVAMNPQILSNGPLFQLTDAHVPIMFTTGTKDTVIPPADVKKAYAKTGSAVPRVFANLQGSDHLEPSTNQPQRFTEYVVAYFDCHLKGSPSQCDKTYGSKSDSLCGGKLKMSECTFEHAPSSSVSV